METVSSIRPLLAILVSLVAPLLILLVRKHRNLREGTTFLVAGTKLLIVLSILPLTLSGFRVEWQGFEIVSGVSFRLAVDPAGMLFALVASSLWIITSIYSIGYMRSLAEHSQTRYYCFFALALSATLGVAFSANLLTMYIFYEMLSLATYPLVTHHQDEESRSSGRKYLLYILGTSIALVLPALLLVYHFTGTLEFSPAGVFSASPGTPVLFALLLMFFFGFAKAGLMPFHSWLPGAMVAPTPVSSLLHAVAVVKVGVFSIIRILTGIFGVDLLKGLSLSGVSASTLLCAISGFTVLIASITALSQDNLKRRLAFSTISQLAFIILGVSLLAPKAVLGGVLHIAMHAFGKITLFFCAGAIYVASGKKYVSELKGLGKRMPWTFGAFFIGALSIVGLPPTGGFISKWYMLLGAIEANKLWVLVIILASSLVKAAALFPIVYSAYFLEADESDTATSAGEAPLYCLIPLLLTAGVSLILFFYPSPFFDLVRDFSGVSKIQEIL